MYVEQSSNSHKQLDEIDPGILHVEIFLCERSYDSIVVVTSPKTNVS